MKFTEEQIRAIYQCFWRYGHISGKTEQLSYIDMDHSSLLVRLLTEGEVTEMPPPLAFSYPWMELVVAKEDRASVGVPFKWWQDNATLVVSINQGVWKLLHKEGEWQYVEYLGKHPWKARYKKLDGGEPNFTDHLVQLLDPVTLLP